MKPQSTRIRASGSEAQDPRLGIRGSGSQASLLYVHKFAVCVYTGNMVSKHNVMCKMTIAIQMKMPNQCGARSIAHRLLRYHK